MAPHSSTLAWKTSWMEEPGRLQSMGWQRVGRDWRTNTFFQRHYFASNDSSSQSYGFSSSHVWMWELDHKEAWAVKNWYFWLVVLGKTLESSLGLQGNQTSHPKGNQPWIFIGRTDAEAALLWPPEAMSWLIGKEPDAGKDWGQEEKGETGWDGLMASLTQRTGLSLEDLG